ncbi:hypothetical protein ACTWPT_57680 [Nonomuraea sp. 3N208]|uniref:hypothetical protein n=1 Tax=Nonomuraea sp. 3N208 TaxID=3457421 RepID=UPI003FD532A7
MGPVTAAVLAAVTALSPMHSGEAKDLGWQVLAPDDGWAAAEGGTSGGVAARHAVTVRTRDELAAAVAGDAPKVVYVEGAIDAGPLSCADYAVPEYDLQSYLAAYHPAHWTGPASGPQEEARKGPHLEIGEAIRSPPCPPSPRVRCSQPPTPWPPG